MNSQNQSNWKNNVQEVDVEINPEESPNSTGQLSQRIRLIAIRVKEWFVSLPLPARIVVGVVAVSMAFSLLNLVLQTIISLASTAILIIILYVLYSKFIAKMIK